MHIRWISINNQRWRWWCETFLSACKLETWLWLVPVHIPWPHPASRASHRNWHDGRCWHTPRATWKIVKKKVKCVNMPHMRPWSIECQHSSFCNFLLYIYLPVPDPRLSTQKKSLNGSEFPSESKHKNEHSVPQAIVSPSVNDPAGRSNIPHHQVPPQPAVPQAPPQQHAAQQGWRLTSPKWNYLNL